MRNENVKKSVSVSAKSCNSSSYSIDSMSKKSPFFAMINLEFQPNNLKAANPNTISRNVIKPKGRRNKSKLLITKSKASHSPTTNSPGALSYTQNNNEDC